MKKIATRKKSSPTTKNEKPKTVNKRRSIRFKPDMGEVAMLNFGSKALIPALIINESFTGACLTCVVNEELKPGVKFTARVGRLTDLKAEIVWVEDVDHEILKFGIEYID